MVAKTGLLKTASAEETRGRLGMDSGSYYPTRYGKKYVDIGDKIVRYAKGAFIEV